MESVKLFKKKMLQWTSTWLQEDQPSAEEVQFTPNAVEIASLLQTTGFRIRFMDRCLPQQMHPVPGVSADSTACRVILMCPHSGLRMELDAPTSSCRCPSPDAGLGNSWTISETASEQMANVVDSIVPRPSSEVSKTVSQLIGGLFHAMNLFPDMNHNNVKETREPRPCNEKNTRSQKSESAKSTCESPMKTPATGIAVVTPNAPFVSKASPENSKSLISGRYRSLDTLIACGGFRDDLPEPGQLTPKDDEKCEPEIEMQVDGDLDATIVEGPGSANKKFISKSSPAVNCTEEFNSSTDFVFENDDQSGDRKMKNRNRMLLRRNTYVLNSLTKNPEEDGPREGPPPKKTPSPLVLPSISQCSILLSKLQDIQQAVSNVILIVAGNEENLSNIGDVSKASKAVAGAVQKITADSVRPIRCLSDFGSVPNLTRPATTVTSIPRPNIRRNATTIAAPSATPTTSRRSGIATLTGGKTSMTSKPGSNLSGVSPGSSLKKNYTSASCTISSSVSKDKEPATRRVSTNSDKKYPHGQSSIPKPGIVRK